MSGDRAGLTVVFYEKACDIRALAPAWDALVERTRRAGSRQPSFFQSRAWLDHVAGIRADRGPDRWRPCFATVWRGDRLTALWPLSLQREGLCWILRCQDHPFGQFAGLVIDPEEDAAEAFDSIIDAIKEEGMAAGLMIERVSEDSPLHRCLTATGARIGFSDRSVRVDFRPFETFQDYLKTRRSKTRKNLRNARNRLERDHGAEHEVIQGGERIRSIMDQAFETRLVWMQDNAKTAPAFRDPDFRPLLDGLAESGIAGELIGFRLKTADQPIAVQWGFLHDRRYYAFISARNPAFDAYSPGRVHLGMVLEDCFARGVEVVELMAPASDYKMNWTDEAVRIDDFALAFTARGYLYLDLWRRQGRAVARRLYHGLPDGIRRHVAAFA